MGGKYEIEEVETDETFRKWILKPNLDIWRHRGSRGRGGRTQLLGSREERGGEGDWIK